MVAIDVNAGELRWCSEYVRACCGDQRREHERWRGGVAVRACCGGHRHECERGSEVGVAVRACVHIVVDVNEREVERWRLQCMHECGGGCQRESKVERWGRREAGDTGHHTCMLWQPSM